MAYPNVHTATFATVTPSTNAATKLSLLGIYVGGTNATTKNVNLVDSRGTTALFVCPAGTTIWANISGVRFTNTTASATLVGFGPQ